MGRITIRHVEAHEKLTARLFWKDVADSGYIDAGNVREYADATARSLVTRARSQRGARHVNAEQVDTNHEAYSFLLDERVPEQERLIRLARDRDDHIQNAVEAASATIENVAPGRWFDVGAWNIANVGVSGTLAGWLNEGDDYDLDSRNGRIHVLPGGSVATGETLHLTFDQPGMSLEKAESQHTPLFYCDIVLEEHNQHSEMWLRRLTFRGNLNVTEFPNQSGEFSTYRVKATPGGPVTILKRPEAATLESAPETGEPAGHSSSSSSSTYSSSSSNSSSSTALSYTSSQSSLGTSHSSASSYSSQTNSSSSTAASLTSSSSSTEEDGTSSSSTALSYSSSQSSDADSYSEGSF